MFATADVDFYTYYMRFFSKTYKRFCEIWYDQFTKNAPQKHVTFFFLKFEMGCGDYPQYLPNDAAFTLSANSLVLLLLSGHNRVLGNNLGVFWAAFHSLDIYILVFSCFQVFFYAEAV